MTSDNLFRTPIFADGESAYYDYMKWLLDGNYTERWEQGFRQHLYHGRTGAYYKSESTANTPYREWTLPEILIADNTIGTAPWNNALRMRNSKDGTTVDELYVGFPKAHHRQVMAFEALLPDVGGATPLDLLYLGFEINSGGSFAVIAGLACHNDQWQLYALNHRNSALTQNVTLRHPDVYSRYALVYNPPILELWEAPVASTTGHPLELTATLNLKDISGKAIPFFANEDTNVSEFRIGDVWIYEIQDDKPKIPTIYNVTMTNANTEYSQALSNNCKAFEIHTRDESEFRLAFVTGKVAAPTAPYLTVLANKSYYMDNINSKLTLYFASAAAGKVIEIVEWT